MDRGRSPHNRTAPDETQVRTPRAVHQRGPFRTSEKARTIGGTEHVRTEGRSRSGRCLRTQHPDLDPISPYLSGGPHRTDSRTSRCGPSPGPLRTSRCPGAFSWCGSEHTADRSGFRTRTTDRTFPVAPKPSTTAAGAAVGAGSSVSRDEQTGCGKASSGNASGPELGGWP